MNSITVFICFSFYKFIAFDFLLSLNSIYAFCDLIAFFIYKLSNYFWSIFFLLVDVNSITVFICFSFYKFVAFDFLFSLLTIYAWRNNISFFVNKISFCFRWWSFLLVDMFCITLFVSFGSYKFISINVFIRLFTIYLSSYSITIFIDVFCYYIWCRSCSFLLVDVFCITFFISFGSYKFISFDIFIRLFTIFLSSYSITIFIDVFCYYIWCRSCSFLLVDVFCITFFISFGSYKFISIDVFIRLCTIFLRRNGLTIFINIFCNYISRWCDFFLVDMFCITLIICFSSYKLISFYSFLSLCSFFWKK